MKENSFFGEFGGYFVPEILIPCLEELESAYIAIRNDFEFQQKYRHYLTHWAGRPTPLYYSKVLSETVGCHVHLKREDLLHGGAHKTNNTLGQGLLAQMMGKKRLIAETGAGQHGVATAMIGALLKIPTVIYMGAKDIERQAPNVSRMRLFGAEVRSVSAGGASLKGAINDALRDWCTHPSETFYVFGTAAGPHPFPSMVKAFQQIIGQEIAEQLHASHQSRPEAILACVGGGSNAIGAFAPFIDDTKVQLIGAEPGGTGLDKLHGAALNGGKPGCIHGSISFVLQDDTGQIAETHSISAGLDYPGVGPEHAHLHKSGRAEYIAITDDDALDACLWLCQHEGILCALESAHAIALALKLKNRFSSDAHIVINLSGRGDKDLDHIRKLTEVQ